ncbi:MAG: polyphosphate kinase 2 family protein [Gammaproteobacteria bacterium]|nr:polyphosphate kinase 2 family protein [Gammaproteobacteria bacterium]
MKIDLDQFRVPQGRRVRLQQWPTRVGPLCADKAAYRRALGRHVATLSRLQNVLYAHDRYCLLLIFQGMDAAGKDGAIRHVMSGVNPQGCQVYSFKHPEPEALEHDFLWRTTKCLPERGRIGIFNRSYYEEVLIVRVHPEILAAQRLPEAVERDEDLWKRRYRSIAGLERHLHENGTRIVKFFLHLSQDEQRRRFVDRIDDPDKNWKLSCADVEERKYWRAYQRAYEDCLGATSADYAPWYVVPADHKDDARLIISEAVVHSLKSLKMAYPKPSADDRRRLQAIRDGLVAEG